MYYGTQEKVKLILPNFSMEKPASSCLLQQLLLLPYLHPCAPLSQRTPGEETELGSGDTGFLLTECVNRRGCMSTYQSFSARGGVVVVLVRA